MDIQFKYNKFMDHQMIECPVCLVHVDDENSLEHFINHFENSQYFLFDRCNLIFWCENYVKNASNESIKRGEDTKSVVDVKDPVDGKNESDMYFCKACKAVFNNYEQLSVHTFVHFQVVIPSINLQLKCPLCEKYFCDEEACMLHIFSHTKMLNVQDIIPSVKNWLKGVFVTNKCKKLLTSYHRYAEKLNSTLLSKILLSEVEAVKNCKFCLEPVSSVFDLLEKHDNCRVRPLVTYSYCILCNFKASGKDQLLKHFFLNHIMCYCGYRGEDFNGFLAHSAVCNASRNGILCKFCCARSFSTVIDFKKHIGEFGRRSCTVDFKKSKGSCVICKTRTSQKDIFNHMISQHTSCLCGHKSKDITSFTAHTSRCVIKKKTVVCPICHKVRSSTEKHFKEHVTRCLPWEEAENTFEMYNFGKVENFQEISCHGENKNTKKTSKRENEEFYFEIPSKKIKLNLELSS